MLVESLESVLAQSHSALEVWVGVDGAPEEASEISRRFQDPRLRVKLFVPRRGPFAVYRALLEMATGEYVSFFSNDDRMHREFARICLNRLEATGADLVFTDHYRWDGADGRVPDGRLNLNATVFRVRSLHLVAEHFGEVFPREMRQYADEVLLFRMRTLGMRTEHVAGPGIDYRIHADQMSQGLRFRMILDRIHARNLIEDPQPRQSVWELATLVTLKVAPAIAEMAGPRIHKRFFGSHGR